MQVIVFLSYAGYSRQPKESEKGSIGMIGKGKRILMLKLS